MADSVVKKFIIELINKEFDKREEKYIKQKTATVVSSNGNKSVVKMLKIDNEQGSIYETFELINYSGQTLSAGDTVWIHYTSNISTGIIARKNI